MGELGNDDGKEPPDHGGQPDGLPGLPPEWGTIVVPDDPSELAEEAEAVRRELRSRRVPGARPDHEPVPALGGPLLIMIIAMIATMASLFAVSWQGQVPRTGGTADPGAPATGTSASLLPAVTLTGAGGAAVPLRELVPAAVLLVEGCSCGDLIAATVAAAPAGVSVIAVRRDGPANPAAAATTSPTGGTARTAVDAKGELRAALGLGPPTTEPVVLLVDRTGKITNTIRGPATVDAFRSGLEALGSG